MKNGWVHVWVAFLAAVPAPGLGATTPAGEGEGLPYRMYYESRQAAHSLEHLDKLIADIGFFSDLEGVPPNDIRLMIDDGHAVHEFMLDERGHADIPVRADWNDADLTIRTDGSGGTVSFGFGFAARPLPATRLRYRDVMDIGRQFGEAMTRMTAAVGEPAPDIRGLEFRFDPAAGARVTILAGGGDQVSEGGADGIIRLAEDPALWEQNPEVVFSALPQSITPWFGPGPPSR